MLLRSWHACSRKRRAESESRICNATIGISLGVLLSLSTRRRNSGTCAMYAGWRGSPCLQGGERSAPLQSHASRHASHCPLEATITILIIYPADDVSLVLKTRLEHFKLIILCLVGRPAPTVPAGGSAAASAAQCAGPPAARPRSALPPWPAPARPDSTWGRGVVPGGAPGGTPVSTSTT